MNTPISKKNGIKSVIVIFMFIIAIETLAVHLLIEQWSNKAAWILSFVSLYTCLQIWALIKSMDRRPSFIDYENRLLTLRYGFFNVTVIPFKKLQSIQADKRTLPNDKSIIQFSPLGMIDTHNLVLSLHENHIIDSVYGFTKEYKKLAILIDEKERFIKEIQSIIENKR